MSTTSELEARANDLRKLVTASTPAEELAETERQLTAALEAEARTAAEAWLAKTVLAIKKLVGSLDEMLDRVQANPNTRDVGAANAIWTKIVAYAELVEVVVRRCPGIKVPTMPILTPPGRRGLKDVAGLSIETPRRHLFPVVIASDSPELRERIFQRAAYEYLRGTTLPDDLRALGAVAVPEPDMSERIATDHTETERQRAAAMRASRVW